MKFSIKSLPPFAMSSRPDRKGQKQYTLTRFRPAWLKNLQTLRSGMIISVLFLSLFVVFGHKAEKRRPMDLKDTDDESHSLKSSKTAFRWALVAAKTANDDVSWIYEFCEQNGCRPFIYNMDLIPEESLQVPHYYQGHEASAYLSYIVDHYNDLHDYTLFLHGKDTHWHNDVAGPETRSVLRNLRFEAVKAYGYVNLRCSMEPGCPSTLYQKNPEPHDKAYQYVLEQLPELFHNLLGIDPKDFPKDVGHQCCAQFALTKEQIQKNPRVVYRKIMQWVGTTDITDNFGIGWLTEKIWHIIFQMPSVLCPSEAKCRCDLYGWCGPNALTDNKVLKAVGS